VIIKKTPGYDGTKKILLKKSLIPTRSIEMCEQTRPVLFQSIVVSVPNKEIYARLGYRRDRTKIPPAKKELVETWIDHALGLMELKGAATVLGIDAIEGASISLKGGCSLHSAGLARMISGCTEVVLLGATAGSRIMEEIRGDTTGDNITRGVVLDAVASEMTDKALDWIMGYVNQDLKRRAKMLTRRRYSAGYGDFALENQQIMYDMLMMNELGVKITEDYLLVPEKSVTAIAGIYSSRQ